MGIFNSSNPALNDNTIKKLSSTAVYEHGQVMTISGTINKTIFGVLVVMASAAYTFWAIDNNPSVMMPLFIIGLIGSLGAAIATIAKPHLAKYTMLLYALFEGLLLGGISIVVPPYFDAPIDVVAQAVGATVVTFFVMLLMYRTGIIKVTRGFRTVVIAATAGLATMYVVFFVMSLFGTSNFLMGTSIMSIGVTAFAAVLAALNLAMDFDLISRLEQNASPKYMEWYGAFSILVTLVWLYMEFLRLFSKLNSNRN